MLLSSLSTTCSRVAQTWHGKVKVPVYWTVEIRTNKELRARDYSKCICIWMTPQKTLRIIKSSMDAVLLKSLFPPQVTQRSILVFSSPQKITEVQNSKTRILRKQTFSAWSLGSPLRILKVFLWEKQLETDDGNNSNLLVVL